MGLVNIILVHTSTGIYIIYKIEKKTLFSHWEILKSFNFGKRNLFYADFPSCAYFQYKIEK